jgi:hypothetical protein
MQIFAGVGAAQSPLVVDYLVVAGGGGGGGKQFNGMLVVVAVLAVCVARSQRQVAVAL